MLLVGLVILVLVSSLGAFFLLKSNQSIPSQTNTTATAPSGAISTATSTTQAINTSATQATQATATANANPYPPGRGTLTLYDPLRDNTRGYNWYQNSTDLGACSFIGEAYHVSSPKTPYFQGCAAQNTRFSNFTYEVKLTFLSGNCGAIIFRADFVGHRFYFFRICQDGSYQLLLYTQKGTATKTFIEDANPTIHTGLGQSNVIAVGANNDSIALYVNHQFINSIQDSTYSQGQIGVAADNDNSPTEVAFSNVRVWTL